MTILQQVYQRLLTRWGHQAWWPGDGPTDVLIGAVLVQNTSWNNVERALDNLREAGALSLDALAAMPADELAELIRPAGYYQVKTRRLKNLLAMIAQRYDGQLDALLADSAESLRDNLLSVNGIGRETADAIVLYAAGKPRFVVDVYTHRVMARHGWIEFDADYDALQQLFESSLEPDAAMFNEYHALLVRLGKEHCRKTPLCAGCPLEDLLPSTGICEPF